MHASLTSIAFTLLESILCLAGVMWILRRKQRSPFKFLCFFLLWRFASNALNISLILLAGHGISVRMAYAIYFYSYHVGSAVESVLGLLLIYSIFNLAMAPLDGLQRLGTLVFRWAAGTSIAIAVASAITPRLTEQTFIVGFLAELKRTQSILTLCLLLFVCFAIRPMGLSYRSRIFGVSLGLGILTTFSLVETAWAAHFQHMYTSIDTIMGLASGFVLLMWLTYFVFPEPKRRMIVLPTTSPFLRWNQISQILGDEPGFVAIAGVPPELFAPAELEIMRRASLKMAEQPVTTIQSSQSA